MRWQNLGACVKDLSKQYSPEAAVAVCRRLEQRSKDGSSNNAQQQQQANAASQRSEQPAIKRRR